MPTDGVADTSDLTTDDVLSAMRSTAPSPAPASDTASTAADASANAGALPAPQPITLDDVLSLDKDKDRFSALTEHGLEQDPKRAADLLHLQDATGLPTPFIDRNLEAVQKAVYKQGFDPKKYLAEAPEVAAWLSEDPARAGLVRDDLPKLAAIEKLVRASPKYEFQPNGAILDVGPTGLAESYASPQALLAELHRRGDLASIEKMEAIDRVRAMSWGQLPATGIAAAVEGALGTQGGAPEAYQEARSDFRTAGIDPNPIGSLAAETAVNFGAGAGAFLQQWHPQPGTDIIARRSAEDSPGLIGEAERQVGGLVASAPLMALGGPFTKGAMALTDAALGAKTISPLIRNAIAGAAGMQPLAISGALKEAQDHGVERGLESWAIDTGIAGGFGPVGLSKLAASAFGAELPSRAAQSVAMTLAKHAGLSAAEFDSFGFAHRLDAYAHGDANAFDGLRNDMIVQSVLGAVMGVAGGLPEAQQVSMRNNATAMATRAASMDPQTLNRVSSALGSAETLSQVADLAHGTNAMALNQDAIGKLMAKLGDGTPTQTLHVDADAWAKQFPKDAAQRAREATGDQLAYEKALSSGQSLAIPFDAAVKLMGEKEHAQWFADEARTRPDAANRREAMEALTQEQDAKRAAEAIGVPAEVQSASDRAAQEAQVEGSPADEKPSSIRDSVTAASLAAGRKPDEAALHGQVLERIVNTLARRAGVDPQQFFERMKLAMRGPGGEGVPAEAAAQEPHVVKGRNVVVADVPYGGGTSADGKTVYIDRRIPRFHEVDGKRIDLHAMIAEHEIAEKERMDRGETYSKAHGQALAIEDKDVDHQGVRHADYENLLKPYLDLAKKEAQKEQIPADIEPKPYRDMGETHLIAGAIGQGISAEKPLTQPPVAIQPRGASLRSEELIKQWRKAMGDRTPLGGMDAWVRLQQEAFKEDDRRGVFYQDGKAEPQGTFLPARLSPEGQNLITFLKGADRSTFFHETGHLLLEVMHDLASKEDAPPQIAEDVAKIRKWLGAEDAGGIESITRAQHEQFARGLETYLMEGKAPSEGLRSAFKRLKSWLLKLYQGYTDFGVPLSDDIRGVFDRIHATDAEIAQAEARENVRPLFSTPEQAGKTPEEFEAYRKAAEKAHDEAIEHLQTKLARALQSKETKARAEERDKLHAETSDAVDKMPVYVALDAMQDGKVPAGIELEKGQTLKLGKEFLVRDYGKEVLDLLPGPRKGGEDRPNAGHAVYAEGGMDLEEAARVYGFDSGDALVKALLHAPDREAHIEATVDDEMQRRHPDPMADPAMLRLEATKAIASGEARGEVVHAELAALRKLDMQAKALVRQREQATRLERNGRIADAQASIPDIRVVREAARRTVLRTTVKDLKPAQYLAAARKFSDESSKRYLAGDYEKAAAAKQRELLNHELHRAALDTQDAIRKGRDYLKSMNTSAVRRKIVRAAAREGEGNDYMSQIDGVLARVDLKTISADNLATRESLDRWMARMMAEGKSIAIPEDLANESFRRNWKQLPVEQFLAVRDAVRNIAHLAEHADDVSSLAAKASREALVGELTKAAEDNGSPPRRANITTTFGDELSRNVSGINLSLTKLSFQLKHMDGGKMGGVWWNTFSRVLNDNEDAEIKLRKHDAERWTEARKAWGKDAGLDKWNSPYIAHYDPQLGAKISLMGRIMVLLNYGTAKNRERVLNGGLAKGEKLSEQQVQHIIDSLDEKDIRYAKSIWDIVGGHRQALEAQSRRLSGVVQKWEDGIPIQTRFGEVQGRYFPIRYDTEEGARRGDAVFSTDSQAYSYSPSTRAGFLENRVESTGLRLRLDETAIAGHLAEVAHRLAQEDSMQAFGKILRNKDVFDTITKNFGVGAYRLIRDTILRVAQGDYRENDSAALAYARRGVTVFHQGYNILTSMFNLTGIAQSMTRVPPQYFLKAVSHLFPGSSEETSQRLGEAAAKSKVLANHEQYFIREQRELMNQQSLRSMIPGMQTAQKHAYLLQRMTQKFADHVVWRAAFEQAIEQFPEDEQKAVDIADQQVLDTQSSGAMKDLPGIQTGGEAKKLLTMFYTWFSSRHNLTAEAFRESKRAGFLTSLKGAPTFGLKMLQLYTVPVVIEGMLLAGIRKALGGKDDDKSLTEWLAREHLAAFMSNYPGIRELANAALNRPYNGPTILQPLSEASRVVRSAVSGDFDKIRTSDMVDLLGMGLHLPLSPASKAVRGYESAGKTVENPIPAMIFGPPHRN